MNAPAFRLNGERSAVGPAVPSLEHKRLRAYLFLVLADVALVALGFALAGLAYRGALPDAQAMLEAQLIVPLFLTIALYQRVYSIRSLTDAGYAIRRIALAMIVAAALLNFIAFYAKFNATFSRGTFTLGIVISGALLAGLRVASAAVLRRRWGEVARNVLVIDDGGPSFTLGHARHLCAGEAGLVPNRDDPDMLNRLGQCLTNQEQVIVTCPAERRELWAFVLRSAGVDGQVISDTTGEMPILGIERYDNQARTGLVVSTGPLGLRGRIGKRFFDLVVAGSALLVLALPMLLIAVAIRLQDGERALFVQKRHGRGNRFFPMFKFRTMRSEHADGTGERSTARDDDRITPLGRFLRQTSIDELPQLFNVLRGEMSIVGPRPHAIASQAGDKRFWEVDERYWHRHSLKPGMTGLAQVRGHRGATEKESDLEMRLQSDLEYIANWSLQRDLMIAVRTLGVLRHHNAY
ncbi:sugar transferase [Erythrobacter sp. HKB08]|uniref:sugar transferase n=1 Tax=Erythrobacter sp. HKB08 TaxID=2502843 RepID=UPI0010088ABF|nr:sugar transferase [Erythrobacter sp. HKB08]